MGGYQSRERAKDMTSRRETGGVKIEIGPVSRASAVAWLDYATGALTDLRRIAPNFVAGSAIDGFEALITEWRIITEGPGTFHWETDEPPERVEFLIKALYTAALKTEEGIKVHGMKPRPPAADEFHIVLVRQVLDTLAQQGRSNAEFVESLRNEWLIARPD